MKKRRILIITFFSISLSMMVFSFYKIYQKQKNDFSFSIVKDETISFLKERTSIINGEKDKITDNNDFYRPKDKQKEKKLRERIYSYYIYLQEVGLHYKNPTLTLEIQKVQKRGSAKAIVIATEEVMMQYGKEKMGYGNHHKFIYEKQKGKWKLIDNIFLDPYSMIIKNRYTKDVDI